MVKLDNEIGSICISSEVFTWLAGDAATRCFGVKGMAGARQGERACAASPAGIHDQGRFRPAG